MDVQHRALGQNVKPTLPKRRWQAPWSGGKAELASTRFVKFATAEIRVESAGKLHSLRAKWPTPEFHRHLNSDMMTLGQGPGP